LAPPAVPVAEARFALAEIRKGGPVVDGAIDAKLAVGRPRLLDRLAVDLEGGDVPPLLGESAEILEISRLGISVWKAAADRAAAGIPGVPSDPRIDVESGCLAGIGDLEEDLVLPGIVATAPASEVLHAGIRPELLLRALARGVEGLPIELDALPHHVQQEAKDGGAHQAAEGNDGGEKHHRPVALPDALDDSPCQYVFAGRLAGTARFGCGASGP